MLSKLKDLFSYQISQVNYDKDLQLFEIEDNVKKQLVVFQVINLLMIFLAVINYLNFDELNWLTVTPLIIFPILAIFNFFLLTGKSKIALSEIKYLIYSKGNNSIGLAIKLKNRARRTLYVLERDKTEEIVTLFRNEGVLIKNK